MPSTTISDVRTVGITVADQDAAIDFYVGTLGFEKRLDAPMSETTRWIEVAPRARRHRSRSALGKPPRT